MGLFADKTGTNRTVTNLGHLEKYVYEVNGGEGIYLYHVEQVSAFRALYEFERSQWTFIGHQQRTIVSLQRCPDASSKADCIQEFPADRLEVLQSKLSLAWHQPTDEDPTSTSHSTGTASKATGERFGSAKKATLIDVKMADIFISEIATVFDQGTYY